MSSGKISPKVIDVEGNRIPFINEKDYKIYLRKNKSFENSIGVIGDNYIEGKGVYGSGKGLGGIKMGYEKSRFPTQLFTNNKNDKFKYVKTID